MEIHVCNNVGVSGTTPCIVRQYQEGEYVARMGFALLGTTNMTEEQFKACGYDPFHEDFRDNFVEGRGKTYEEAIEAMKQDLEQMANSLWAM